MIFCRSIKPRRSKSYVSFVHRRCYNSFISLVVARWFLTAFVYIHIGWHRRMEA
jgi:hypothetical protein